MTCDACLGRWPDPGDRIADLGATVAYLHVDQFFPGWTVLVLQHHATELFQLSREARSALIEELSRAAAALHAAFEPIKVNYACLGNVLPHLHWHLIPRLVGDPAPREAVWAVPHAAVRLDGPARTERIARIRGHLSG